MLLSIIIPIYNKEDVLDRCFESLIKIQSTQVEFIVVNDGSSDGTFLEPSKIDFYKALINKELWVLWCSIYYQLMIVGNVQSSWIIRYDKKLIFYPC